MKVIRIDPQNPAPDMINLAVSILKNGGVVCHPTDTCYGLAVDVANPGAVRKLYDLKRMLFSKPTSMIVEGVEDARRYADFNEEQGSLLKKHWPGKVTFILSKRADFPFDFNREHRSIGLRMPKCAVSLALVRALGRPITTTSANISGGGESYSLLEILAQFEGKDVQPDLVLDGGELKRVKPSTVVSLAGGEVEVIREGEISF